MISVTFLKMGKHSDFRVSAFQVVEEWRILQFNRKTDNILKSLHSLGERCHNITNVCMDL